ncbi:hypothetical protein [Yersinia enterocolitica]|uniref:hypothetical protein n=1 Tax=Yersinia enterocolitica TaxID=630 RepID=UPI00065A8B2C|nr:hypothetical protein [Yersinia enterocolitica]CRY10824.1 Uncharacterised protein [Yersinia enterocolitica]
MMDITKSQSDFEAWLKSKMPTTYRLAFECSDDDELTNLAKASVLDMRTAWQASRESIEVELPQRQSLYASGYGDGYFVPSISGEGLEYDEVVEALRTVGIRIKGESDES